MSVKCKGKRYSEEIEQHTIDLFTKPHTISNINDLSVESILSLAEELNISEAKQHILQNIINMNIGYLTLNRIMGTLSGGELTRLYLAEFMAVSENAVIIIDEISVGLDHETLLQILAEIKQLGCKIKFGSLITQIQYWIQQMSNCSLDPVAENMVDKL